MKKETTMEKKADVRNGTKRLIFAGIALIIEIAFLAICKISTKGQAFVIYGIRDRHESFPLCF